MSKPNSKVTWATIGFATASLVVIVLNRFVDEPFGDDFQGSLGTVAGFLFGYFAPDKSDPAP